MGPHKNIVIDLAQTYYTEFFNVFFCFFKGRFADGNATTISIGQMKVKFKRIVKCFGFGTLNLFVYEQ